ncbi:MAG TPA: 3'(2'),5'-bisphosphate nucleotidase CysQ [Telluria sp.]|nr:3'(2'),5'-bisphosphate nucleotidase CysQ [Telluria sp.]
MRQTIPFDDVLALARAAGAAIMSVYNDQTQLDLQHKADASPLTAADLASHRIIVDGLARLTPTIPVISEEDTAPQVQNAAAERFWLIDPLDGTKEFIARNGEFTVNIALIDAGHPVWGVVYAPALGELFWGGPGLGAFRTCPAGTRPIGVGAWARKQSEACRVVASKSHLNEETNAFIGRLGAHELIQAGSSLKLCRVAEGAAHVYPRLGPTCEWDTAAAHAVVEGAGGHVVQLDGTTLRYGKADVLNPYFVACCVPLGELVGSDD